MQQSKKFSKEIFEKPLDNHHELWYNNYVIKRVVTYHEKEVFV